MSDPKIEKLTGVLKDVMAKPERMPLHRHHDDDYWDEVTVEASGAIVHARIVPRYKTSGLSGDEWRISAVLSVHLRSNGSQTEVFSQTFHRMKGLLGYASHFLWKHARTLLARPDAVLVAKRKGVVLMRQEFPTLGDAAMGMGWHITIANEGSRDVKWHHLTNEEERARCQQVGCSELPKNVYHLKKIQKGNSHETLLPPKYDFEGQYTWYCSRHTERGDCGLEDADDNLVLVEGSGVPVVRPEDESPSMLGGVIDLTED